MFELKTSPLLEMPFMSDKKGPTAHPQRVYKMNKFQMNQLKHLHQNGSLLPL